MHKGQGKKNTTQPPWDQNGTGTSAKAGRGGGADVRATEECRGREVPSEGKTTRG